METRASYILVGAFILATIGLAFLAVLYFGSAQREYDEYRIVFEEQVSGLSEGGQVRFNGIQVGEVIKLEINKNGNAEALVRIARNTPVKTDTVARLEIVGFTGLAVIQFEGGSPQNQMLNRTVSGTPVLIAEPSDIGQLLQGGEEIVKAVNRVLSDKNIENISGTLENIEILTQTFADSSDDIALLIGNASQLTKDLARASDDLDRLLKDLDALATGEGQRALANVEKVADEARTLVLSLNSVVNENRKNLQAFTSTGLQQVGPGMTEIRRLVRTMDNFLRQLERDPRGYLLGEPVPEYEAAQ